MPTWQVGPNCPPLLPPICLLGMYVWSIVLQQHFGVDLYESYDYWEVTTYLVDTSGRSPICNISHYDKHFEIESSPAFCHITSITWMFPGCTEVFLWYMLFWMVGGSRLLTFRHCICYSPAVRMLNHSPNVLSKNSDPLYYTLQWPRFYWDTGILYG